MRKDGFFFFFVDSYLLILHSIYIDEMYSAWQKDPTSVHKSWDVYFRTGSFAPSPDVTSSVEKPTGTAV